MQELFRIAPDIDLNEIARNANLREEFDIPRTYYDQMGRYEGVAH